MFVRFKTRKETRRRGRDKRLFSHASLLSRSLRYGRDTNICFGEILSQDLTLYNFTQFAIYCYTFLDNCSVSSLFIRFHFPYHLRYASLTVFQNFALIIFSRNRPNEMVTLSTTISLTFLAVCVDCYKTGSSSCIRILAFL